MSNNLYLEETNPESEDKENGVTQIVDEIAKEVKNDEVLEKEKLLLKLKETEDEIETLRQVLGSKIRLAHYLRRTIGITPIDELKDDINYGLNIIKSSDKYKTTAAVIQNAKLKTQSTLNTAGNKISEKWESVKQTDKYKQWTSKVNNAQNSIKKHLTSSPGSQMVTPTTLAEIQSTEINNDDKT